jgi:type IV pilus assembly protein PilV
MHKASGFTLIEVLIAMVILSVGLLGLAGLQAAGLRNNQSAYYRSQATLLAYNIADRIRANIDDAGKLADSTYVTLAPADAAVQADCSTVSATCTTADMAENDLFEWNSALAALPSGTGTITIVGATRTFTVTINWDDNRDDAVNISDPNFVMSFQI